MLRSEVKRANFRMRMRFPSLSVPNKGHAPCVAAIIVLEYSWIRAKESRNYHTSLQMLRCHSKRCGKGGKMWQGPQGLEAKSSVFLVILGYRMAAAVLILEQRWLKVIRRYIVLHSYMM